MRRDEAAATHLRGHVDAASLDRARRSERKDRLVMASVAEAVRVSEGH